MRIFDKSEFEQVDYAALINYLKQHLSRELIVPQRQHLAYPTDASEDSTLLIMPAWKKKYLGVKLVTVSPENTRHDLPSIHGQYMLFNQNDGRPIALMDGKRLTSVRTAATSALMSSYLSREDSKTLFMIGTGDLAPELIKAHSAVRPLNKILLWGRSKEKAIKLKNELSEFNIEVIDHLSVGFSEADIISAATLSKTPLVLGEQVNSGAHVDLVGSYKPDMREADDILIANGSIYVDSIEGATKESGDLKIPLEKNVISLSQIQADMFQLCEMNSIQRKSEQEITIFKSVGHASEDLLTAQYFFELK